MPEALVERCGEEKDISILSVSVMPAARLSKGVLCTAKRRGGGGGRKRAVSPQCEVRLKMVTAEPA